MSGRACHDLYDDVFGDGCAGVAGFRGSVPGIGQQAWADGGGERCGQPLGQCDPFVGLEYRTVQPGLVAELAADTAIDAGRHRHPVRFLRVREDLTSEEVEPFRG